MTRILKALFILTLMLVETTGVKAQTASTVVVNEYHCEKASDLMHDVILLIYSDNSYLNFGVYENKVQNEYYVWYSTGTADKQENSYILQSSHKTINHEQVKKQIKQYYRNFRFHALIANYYEFEPEEFSGHKINVSGETASDPTKQLNYILRNQK